MDIKHKDMLKKPTHTHTQTHTQKKTLTHHSTQIALYPYLPPSPFLHHLDLGLQH